MKIKSCSNALWLCLPLLMLAACQLPTAENDTGSQEILVNYSVDMAAAKDAAKIEISTPAQGCGTDGKGRNGCVEFGKNQVGTVELRLNAGTPGRTCLTNPPADWVITKVELSASGDPETDKGTFANRPPPAWMVDAFPGVNPKSGVLYDQPDTSRASQSVAVIDLNNHRDGSVKIAYYQVTASSCGDRSKTIQIDPAMINKGK
jgi:uncharacterized protein YcfL